MQADISQEGEVPQSRLRKKPQKNRPSSHLSKPPPLAKKLARDYGIDLSTIKGSGPGARVLK